MNAAADLDRKKKNIVELTCMSPQQFREASKYPLAVLADNVRSLYNIGSLFRVGDCFRIHSIILGGITGMPPHPEISKTALGAEETVKWRHVEDPYEEAVKMQREGWKILVLEQTHGSVYLHSFVPSQSERYVLVIGNEVEGVDQRIVDIADTVIEIRQFGTKHSLNVASSASIAIYSIVNAMASGV